VRTIVNSRSHHYTSSIALISVSQEQPMIRSLGTLILCLAGAAQADAQPTKKDTAVDTTFLRTLAQTRSFQLGRPQHPRVTPDGKAVLFLRSEARSTKLSLFEFNVASGK